MPRVGLGRASTMSSVTGRVRRMSLRSASTRSPAGAEVEDQPPQALAQRGAGVVRAGVAPEPRGQPLAALDLVGLQRDVDQHRHRLAAGDRRLAAADHQPRRRAGGDRIASAVSASSHHISGAAAPGRPRPRRPPGRAAAEAPGRRPWRPRARRSGAGRSADRHDRPRSRQCAAAVGEPGPGRRPVSRPAASPRTRRTAPAPAPHGPAAPGRPAAGRPARARCRAISSASSICSSSTSAPRAAAAGSARRLEAEGEAAAVGVAGQRADDRHPGAAVEHEKSVSPRRSRPGAQREPSRRRGRDARGVELARGRRPRATSRRRVALDQLEERRQPRRRADPDPAASPRLAAAPRRGARPRARPPQEDRSGRHADRPAADDVASPPRAAAPARVHSASIAGSPGSVARAPDRRVCASTSAVSPASRAAASARSAPPPPTGNPAAGAGEIDEARRRRARQPRHPVEPRGHGNAAVARCGLGASARQSGRNGRFDGHRRADLSLRSEG